MRLQKQNSNKSGLVSGLCVVFARLVISGRRLADLLNQKFRWTHDSGVMNERTRSELARRLGIAEVDLISRREAAELLGLDEATLRSGASDYIGYFRQSDAQSARTLYPKPWVEDYKRWRAEGRKGRYPLAKNLGRQQWPDEPERREITRKEAMLMMERWKYRELHRRCEAICVPGADAEALRDAHRKEARLIRGPDGARRSWDDPVFLEVLAKKAQEIALPKGTIVEPAPLASLMWVMWDQVLDKERDWLAAMP